MQKVVILGAGGFAREVYWVFCEDNLENNRWDVLGFVDENEDNHGKILCDIPILGGFEWFDKERISQVKVICGVGGGENKKYFVEKAKALGLNFCTVIHPNVRMSRFVEIGEGTVICAGNIITTQVKIGNYVSLNLDNTIGHDTVIKDYCNVAPGSHISGNVILNEGVDFGTGAVILQGVSVGAWSIIGAGAAVIDDIPPNVTAVGIPATVMKSHSSKSI